jgi:hypothetical protein
MKDPKHISEIIIEFINQIQHNAMKKRMVNTDSRGKYYLDPVSGKRVRLKSGFNYETDSNGIAYVKEPFVSVEMNPF